MKHDPDHPHHEHDHSDGHDHSVHSITHLSRSFFIGITLNALFVAVEFFYGKISGSIALIADAGHNLQDVFSLILSALALWLAGRPTSPSHTYGYKKGTILSALTGSVLLVLVCGGMIWEAVGRFKDPVAPTPGIMMWVAVVGVGINLSSAFLFFRSKDHELNAKSAYTHLLGDAFISLGVVITGFLILKTGWNWLDPVASILIAIFILIASFRLLRESLEQAIDGVPKIGRAHV